MSEAAILAALSVGRPPSERTALERRARVLWLRYCVTPRWTLSQIGDEFGVTPERVRQMETRGLDALRRPSRRAETMDAAPLGSRLADAIWSSTPWPMSGYDPVRFPPR